MDFQDLIYHIQSFGCSVDHVEDNIHWVSNCINAHGCQIEDLPEYSAVTLCHYFYELGISAPAEIREEYDKYVDFRENIVKIPLR